MLRHIRERRLFATTFAAVWAKLLFMVFVGMPTPGLAERTVNNFLIPGVDLSRLAFREGAWCRYVVADEALGQVDTTEVYVGVSAREETDRGTAWWVEIETRPYIGDREDHRVMKLLVLETITQFSVDDSLGRFVLRLYIKNGTRPVQEEDPLRYEDFSLVNPTTDAQWDLRSGVVATTPAGRFTCERKTRTVRKDKKIPTGNVTLITRSEDNYAVWFSDEIPVFRMARCEISRIRETRTEPRISGIPASGRKESKTTAELMAFGFDAEPILFVDPAP